MLSCRALRSAAAGLFGSLLALAAPVQAQNDRIIDTPTGWSYLYGASQANITGQINGGMRPFSLQRTGSAYDTVFVHNSGPYAVSGAVVTYDRTPASMASWLSSNGLRLLDLEVYDSGGSTLMSAVAVPNSGATGTPGWGWLYNVSFADIADWITANPSLRLIDLDVYTIGGTRYYSAVAVANTGNNFQSGWWFYSGLTAAQVTQQLTANNARLTQIEVENSGNIGSPTTFACVMVSSNPGAGWWYPALTPEQVTDLLNQNGARLTALRRYTLLGQTRYAVAMVDNANAQTRRMRSYMGDALSDGTYGFKLKQVDGPVLASLNETFEFEPASMLKILHATYAVRRSAQGFDDLANNIFIRDRCNPNECPNTTTCNSGNESLAAAIRSMMEVSDNNRTWEIEERYGRTTLNNFATSIGLTGTRINHRLGCLCGNPFNTFTAADAVSLYEQIGNGTLFSAAWRDTLFELMLDLDNQGYGLYPTLNAIITQEAASTNLTASEIAAFRAAVRFANKGGGYSCSGTFYRTDGAWASLPFRVVILGNVATINRQYAIATFVHANNSSTQSQVAYRAKEEILREQIREALQSWDAACTAPGVASGPTAQSGPLGGSATFTATASGSSLDRTFRWQRQNGAVWSNLNNIAGRISGATTNTLTIQNLQPSDAANYRLVITNACGTINTSAAALTVTPSCTADFNNDGAVTTADITDFLSAWFNDRATAGTAADVNNSGLTDTADVTAFLTLWFAARANGGC